MAVSTSRIILHFDIHQPIELTELTLSFGSLAKQYRKFLADEAKMRGQKINDNDVKLFITKIENNCILAELAGATNILGGLIPLMDYANIFVDFIKNLNTAIIYFKNLATKQDKVDPSDIIYSKKQCEDLANFLNVMSQNKGGNLSLSVAEFEKETDKIKQLVKFTYTSDEAFEAQKGALIAQRSLEYRGDADHKNVLMYFYQTNVDDPKAAGKTGDRAIIKAISDKQLPVYFVSDLDSDRIKSYKDDPTRNPFKASYRVDVNVEVDRNEIPKFYRIVRLHEIIPEEDNNL